MIIRHVVEVGAAHGQGGGDEGCIGDLDARKGTHWQGCHVEYSGSQLEFFPFSNERCRLLLQRLGWIPRVSQRDNPDRGH